MLGILCEKPSAARNFAKALGGNERAMTGTFDGEQYIIVASRGHLFEYAKPDGQVSAALKDQYYSWDIKNLPWNENDFSWKRVKKKDVDGALNDIKNGLGRCDEIAIATDDDPTGEGELLAWEILDELSLRPKKWSRFFFVDESAKEIQKAFKNRKPIKSMQDDPDYKQAEFRSKFDFLSMQFTRIAKGYTGKKLRQGRLKSAMVFIVGQQLDLVNNYKKVPFYQTRFKDENGNTFTDPEQKQYPDKASADAEVKQFTTSNVVIDSKEMKKSAPPKLLDLASLSAMLAGKGIKAKQVLDVYQKMYEDQVVSYPRTEDKYISPEQFNEMLPLVDKIAGVVGVNTALLTHRSPRNTHVKAGGAHGANRPGTNVPGSLADLSKYGTCADAIYEILAKNFLAMFCEDYEYEHQTAHLEKYPTFKGTLNIAKKPGYKAVFDDSDEKDSDKGFGATADPFVFEGFPPKPTAPTMKWLMKQLEKRDVGTGATRTSIYADVTNERSDDALMSEKKGKINLTDLGRMSYLILPNTHIGSVEITEDMQKDMKAIYKGETTVEECLKKMAQFVKDDIETMKANLPNVQKEFTIAEKCRGIYVPTGKEVAFKNTWGGHEFTDAEIADLLAGKEITIQAISKSGSIFEATGKLEEQEYKGKKYWGFNMDPSKLPKREDDGIERVEGLYKGKTKVKFKREWSGHRFTDDEIAKLLNGDEISFAAKSKAGKDYTAKGSLKQQTYNGNKFWGFKADFGKK